MFSSGVKDNIALEIRNCFEKKNVKDIVDMYEQAVFFPMQNNGVSRELEEALESYYSQSGNIRQAHKVIANIEPFLKKLLFIVDNEEYESLTHEHGLSKTMKSLGVLDDIPNNIKRLLTNPSIFEEIDRSNIKDKALTKAIFLAYQVRNTNSHESEEWSITEMASNINSALITSCYAVWKNRKQLFSAFESLKGQEYDFKAYAKEIVSHYENEIKNGFKYVPLIWAHTDKEDDDKFDIAKIRKNSNKKVMLMGEAGCGKTTLLNYLEYCEAKDYLNNVSNNLPVKISLIEENYKYQSIEEFICNKLSIPIEYCKQMLHKGSLYLYLDGLNEIISAVDVKKAITKDIEKFCELYPQVVVLITDRPYSIVKVNVSNTYKLRKLRRDDILTYAKAQKMYNDLVEAKIIEMLNSEAFKDYEFTPIFINQLVETFSQGMDVPEDEHELLANYLHALFTREYNEKKDYNAAPGRLELLLTELPNLENIEEGVHYSKVLKFFVEKANAYGLSIKAEECLNLALQLGVLNRQGDYIKFYSDEYLTYYLMKSMEL